MLIKELLENKNFKDSDFVKPTEDGREIDFDLKEDLIYFMNNDDNVYRRFFHPAISSCVDRMNENGKVSPKIFKSAVEKSYEAYANKYPIRELPLSLDLDICEDICKAILEEVKKHIDEGEY